MTKILKHLEVKTYTHNDIAVRVRIDYDKATIDLLDISGQAKRWIFAGRTLDYMQGWRNILAAMEYAIGQAEADLKKHVAARDREHALRIRRMQAAVNEK